VVVSVNTSDSEEAQRGRGEIEKLARKRRFFSEMYNRCICENSMELAAAASFYCYP
jgi:hypothetical protein